MRPRRRLLLKLGLFVLAGAIVNVGVAWGLATWTGTQGKVFDLYHSPKHGWLIRRFAGIGFRWTVVGDRNRSDERLPALCGLDDDIAEAISSSGPERPAVGFQKMESGWPLPGLAYLRRVYYHIASLTFSDEVVHGLEIQAGSNRALPLRPIFPGFAINTLFYAAILWLLFAAPGRVRRWRRIRRGLCARCGYPVGTSAVCSECGGAVAINTSTTRECMGLPPPATPALDTEHVS